MIVKPLAKIRRISGGKVFIFVVLLSFFVSGLAQQRKVSGSVIDKNGNPVAFANVFVDNTPIGTISDISGNFALKVDDTCKRLHIKCMGYTETYANIPANGRPMVVKLKETVFQLKDVVVKPGINPANRIIQAAIDNKKKNDFQKQDAYSYTSYNRGVIEFAHDEETSARKTAAKLVPKRDTVKDSFEIFVDEIIDSTYLFFTESVSEYKYKRPDRVSENVIATRTAGTENPIFSIILTQMQSTSFYSSNFNILGVPYINPIRKGTFRRYYFIIQDTTYSGNDTIFGIMFHPRSNKEFNALRGKVFINSNGYAIQSIVAEPVMVLSTFNSLSAMASSVPDSTSNKTNTDSLALTISASTASFGMAEKDNSLVFRIKHLYATDSLGRWRPDFLHFELGLRVSDKNDIMIRFSTTNKIDNFTFNPKLKRREFSDVTLNVDESAVTNDTAVWNRYRPAITKKEKNTFILYDSINQQMKKDGIKFSLAGVMDWLLQAMYGKIKIGSFALDLNKLYSYNGYEHSRWGMGLEWNIAKWLRPSGYFGYGVKDNEWKYGGDLDFFFDRYKSRSLTLFYHRDLKQAASTKLYNYQLLDISGNTEYAAEHFYKVQAAGVKLSLPLWRHVRGTASFSYSRETPMYDSNGIFYAKNLIDPPATTDFAEVGLTLTYEKNDKIRLPKYEISLGTEFSHPVIIINYTRGLSLFDADQSYNRLLVEYRQHIQVQHYGTLGLFSQMGYVDSDVPYSRLFATLGTGNMWYYFRNSFMTIRPHEFVSDRFANLCVSFSFAKPLWKLKHSRPKFFLQVNSIIGTAKNELSFDGMPLKAPEKGILEPCVAINDIINYSAISLGVGYAYRISAYNSIYEKENMAVFMTIGINL